MELQQYVKLEDCIYDALEEGLRVSKKQSKSDYEFKKLIIEEIMFSISDKFKFEETHE